MMLCDKTPHLAQCRRYPAYKYDSLQYDLAGVNRMPEPTILGGRRPSSTTIPGLGEAGASIELNLNYMAGIIIAFFMAARCGALGYGVSRILADTNIYTPAVKGEGAKGRRAKKMRMTAFGVIVATAAVLFGAPYATNLVNQWRAK